MNFAYSGVRSIEGSRGRVGGAMMPESKVGSERIVAQYRHREQRAQLSRLGRLKGQWVGEVTRRREDHEMLWV